MKELIRRLAERPGLAAELLVASLLANLLALAQPIFVIQVLNRYVSFGVDGTLATLTAGAVLAVSLEFGFRQVRQRLAAAVGALPDRQVAEWNAADAHALQADDLEPDQLAHAADLAFFPFPQNEVELIFILPGHYGGQQFFTVQAQTVV
ncbi:MAG: hypothetical protein H7841_17855 [Magnetospirillum sp. WYHS-4]